MKYTVSLGRYKGPKWIPELVFEHEHRCNAADYIRWIATELHRDRDRIIAEAEAAGEEPDILNHPDYQRWQVRDENDNLLQYITTAYPEPWITEADLP